MLPHPIDPEEIPVVTPLPDGSRAIPGVPLGPGGPEVVPVAVPDPSNLAMVKVVMPLSGDHSELAIYALEEPLPERTLSDILMDTIGNHPSAGALEGIDGTFTYAQLAAHLDHHVERLWDAGVGRGDRVGIRVPSGTTDLYTAILATILAGAAYVPVDWDDPDERADTVFSEANVAAVLGENLEITKRIAGHHNADRQPPTLDDDAWIIFTSGTTGKPKGVAITHRAAGALVDTEADFYLSHEPLNTTDRVMAGLSVAFDASCEEMWLAWRHGSTLVAAERDVVRSGEDLGYWIRDKRITAISTVPTLAAIWPAQAMERVRLLIFGGEACPPDLIERLSVPGREVWNTYGPTEATVIATAALLQPGDIVRIGRPIRGWELTVVGPEGVPVRWGETGELVIGGIGLGRYLDAEKDVEKYAPLPALGWNRAYRTGDHVVADRQGLLFAGRIDDQIKIGGRRLELGEIDDGITRLPGVLVGAAAKQTTNSGTDVLIGYFVSETGEKLDHQPLRERLAQTLPGGIVPSLFQLDEMPLKTSGKVDRKALPWPLPVGEAGYSPEIDASLEWLRDEWGCLLGPVPLGPDSDFFANGGSSVLVARLLSVVRGRFPDASIAGMYQHSTLESMGAYLQGLSANSTANRERQERPEPQSPTAWSGVYQSVFLLFLYVVTGLRYVCASLAMVWLLGFLFRAGWVPNVPWYIGLTPWLLLFTLPARMVWTAVAVRFFNSFVKPGVHHRGSWVHLCLWSAERLLTFQKLDVVYGTPFNATLHRMFGNKVGRDAVLYNAPPIAGLARFGDDVSVEVEADLSGYWVDGDKVHLDHVILGDNVRVGARSIASPGATVERDAEIEAGSHIHGVVPAGELWGGSPFHQKGIAGRSWPLEKLDETRTVPQWGSAKYRMASSLAILFVGAIPILSIIPGGTIIMSLLIDQQFYEPVFVALAWYVPVFTLLTALTWLAVIVCTIRILAGDIAPGYFAVRSRSGLSSWMTWALLQRSLVQAYPIYASWLTPAYLRLLGAKVGKNVEISTIETIPHLTRLDDGCFIADHASLTSTRMRRGWLHIGTTVIGERSFVGNSAMVGPDRDLPPDTLLAVLSEAPEKPAKGTTWIGKTATEIPRARVEADTQTTYNPSKTLRTRRILVEMCRLIPLALTSWVDLLMIFGLTWVYMHGDSPLDGLLDAALIAPLYALAGAAILTLIPLVLKWTLIGYYPVGDRPLFSSFVWRGELVDVFVEQLAVPHFLRHALGSPLFNAYQRLMGVKIGRGAWVETWWLPEFDLVNIGERATINRGTVLQTHLFQDRVMSMERVFVHDGATLGPNSFMLPGSEIEARSTVGPASLVLRQEVIPPDGYWAGNPAQRLNEKEVTHHG
ncbi:Pls/PosA family non-ribosomal peptide synthetase [Neomicrococcus aestuarii]|nr:Pls/PosA family non-ribosomal peptide synthetase [Neomicrococcus aestuarii]